MAVEEVWGWPLWSVQVLASLAVLGVAIGAAHWGFGPKDKDSAAPLHGVNGVHQNGESAEQRRSFAAFQRKFLGVYLVVMLADWLQGTNMYTLYQSYGVNIGALFITGFSSSAIFGTFLGILVDRFGRKTGCVVFCILEIIINYLEHFSNFHLLLLGRVLGGITTSLLFSAFESWMVSEHRKRGYPEEWLVSTFSLASVGNGLVAIVAGLIAQLAADYLGDIGPFQAAIALTTLALVLVLFWEENYGHAEDDVPPLTQSFKEAWTCILSDKAVFLLGSIQSLFEGAVYTFVFMWVPTMLRVVPDGNLPTGIVFSCFMMSITIGGILFKWMLAVTTVERGSILVFFAAAVAMVVPIYTNNYLYILAAFLVIEVVVGMFFACAATMRSEYIPDALQSSIMNIFRLPLNIFVVVGTHLSDHANPNLVFATCSVWFALASLLQWVLTRVEDAKTAAGKEAEKKKPAAKKKETEKKKTK